MKTVRLYGDMGKRFGRVFRLDIATPAEAIRALSVLKPGFRQYLADRFDQPFKVVRGTEELDEQGMVRPFGRTEVIKIVPVVAGSKSAFGQILLGAALIAVAAWTGGASMSYMSTVWGAATATAVTGIGISMVMGGVAQLLAKTQGSSGADIPGNDLATWSFGSPTITTGQGGSVPLGYGLHRIGGHVISAGIDAQTWQDKGFGGAAPDNAGTLGGNGDTSPWVWAIAP